MRNRKHLFTEVTVLLCYAALQIYISMMHEPWFDEAQAWQIAKCASFYDMLFVIPHYEGHPPLWHLILAIPAKLGVPFEIGLKSIGFLLSCTVVYLLIFRSGLPRAVRLVLPFTYFVFYQYGIIVRPYSLMMIVAILLGIELPQRGDHPWRIFSLLLVLCLTSAYGILLAGGISICILWELLKEKNLRKLLAEVFNDPRTLSLFLLFICALIIVAEILPREDTFAAATLKRNPLYLQLVVAVFTFPGECFFTSSKWFHFDRTLLSSANLNTTEVLIFSIIGIIFWALIICASSKESLKFLLVPYFLLAVFAACVYFSGHHLGIVFILFLLWAELLSHDEHCFEIGRDLLACIAKTDRDVRLLRRGYLSIAVLCILVPLFWTVCACVNDIRLDYSYGRNAAQFLEDHGLLGTKLFCAWEHSGSLRLTHIREPISVSTRMTGGWIKLMFPIIQPAMENT